MGILSTLNKLPKGKTSCSPKDYDAPCYKKAVAQKVNFAILQAYEKVKSYTFKGLPKKSEVLIVAFGILSDERNLDSKHSTSGFLRDVENYIWNRAESFEMSIIGRTASKPLFALAQDYNNLRKEISSNLGLNAPRSNQALPPSAPSPSAKIWAIRGYDDGAKDADGYVMPDLLDVDSLSIDNQNNQPKEMTISNNMLN